MRSYGTECCSTTRIVCSFVTGSAGTIIKMHNAYERVYLEPWQKNSKIKKLKSNLTSLK